MKKNKRNVGANPILPMQITHKKETQKIKKTLLQDSTLQSIAGQSVQQLASSEQARRVTDERREKLWEMAELKDHQQQGRRAGCNFTHA